MMELKITIVYNIGDAVYYATPDGDKGIIVDAAYSLLTNLVTYKVSFGRFPGDEVWCTEVELSNSKIF